MIWNVHFRPVPAREPIQARARYRPADHILIVGADQEPPAPTSRISIETLTLLFSSDEHLLVGLDAYTNSRRWKRQPLANPPADQVAALTVADVSFDEHGVGPGNPGPVDYFYARDALLLLMVHGRGPAVTHVQCLSCVVCGLGPGGELVQIWVQGVSLS